MPLCRGDTALLHSLAPWLSSHKARATCPAPCDMVTAVTGSTWSSEIAPVVSPASTVRITSTPRFSAVGRTGSINCARPGAAVYEAELSSPQRLPQDRLIRRLPSLPRLVGLCCRCYRASLMQPAASSQHQKQTPSCPQRCLSSKHRFNGCLVSWISYSMSACLLVAD